MAAVLALLGTTPLASAQIAVTPIPVQDNGFVSLSRNVWTKVGQEDQAPKVAFCLEKPAAFNSAGAQAWCKKFGTAQQYLDWRYPKSRTQLTRWEYECHGRDSLSCEHRINLYFMTSASGYSTVSDPDR